MLEKDELEKIIEEYHRSQIQSEAEVSSKLILSLISWLDYPTEFRSEQFPVYGYSGGRPLPAKQADFIMFDSVEFGNNRERKQDQLDWVKDHSLLVVEAKKPGKMPDIYGQAQFYANWTKAIGYIYIDGNHIIGFLLSNKTADIRVVDCDIPSLINNEAFLQFSYGNIENIKKAGIDHVASLNVIQYKKRISEYDGLIIPESNSFIPITRYIVPFDHTKILNNSELSQLPFDILKQEKHIVLLSGAGQGKTFLMYQICREAKSQGFHYFFFKLQSITSNNIFYSIAQDKIVIDEKVVFVFDGFDEMSQEQRSRFIQATKDVTTSYPDILIVISSRENTYSAHFSKTPTYMLKAITEKEIRDFVVKFGIDLSLWEKAIKQNDLQEYSTIPFYLSVMIEKWLMDGRLSKRKKIIQEFIRLRIKTDIDHVHAQSMNQRHHLAKTKEAFEKIALMMQCIRHSYLTNIEINALFDQAEQDILRCHGILETNEAGVLCFTHNNYREYLAAAALSRMDLDHIMGFIAAPPYYSVIRPTWMDVLSYLVDLYHSDELLEWIINHQPELIALFEKDRISEIQRTDILKKVISKSKEDNTWIQLYSSIMSDLIAFCSTPFSVHYVVEELQQKQSDRHRHNLLLCLECFTSFFKDEQIIISIVTEIAFCEKEQFEFRCDAFRIMSHHPHLFHDYIGKAADLVFRHHDEYLLYSIVSFIQSTGEAENQIDAVINAFDKYNYLKNHLISLKMITYSILSNIKGINAACKLVRLYPKWIRMSGKMKEEIDSLLRTCCKVGITCFDGDDDSFLQELLSLFKNKLHFLDHEMSSILSNYIESTHTASMFLDAILAYQPASHHGLILSQLISDSLVATIENRIAEHSIKKSTVEDLVRFLQYDCTYQKRLVKAVYFNMHETIKIDPPIDYKSLSQAEHQRFFDALFDEDLFSDLVNELLGVLGANAKIGEDSFNTLFSKTWDTHKGEHLNDCYFALRRLSSENAELKISEYRLKINNWDQFCFSNAAHCLQNHSVEIDEAKKQYLSEYCKSIFEKLDIEKALHIKGNSLSLPLIIPDAAKIFKILPVKCSEELAIKLLLLPPALFNDRDYDQLPECVTCQIKPEVLRMNIINLIHNRIWNRFTAPGFILYCKENKIVECKQEIIQFALDHELNDGFTYPALDYLEELFGISSILNDILPYCDSEELLSDLSARIPNNISSPLLVQKLWEAYRNNKEERWLVQLIKHNNLDALQEYYSQAKELQKLPDWSGGLYISGPTEAIHDITSLSCLHLLVDLYVLSNDPRFTDKDSFGLKNSCWNAIKTIANNNYEEVKEAILNSRSNDASVVDIALQDLLEAIENQQRSVQDKPLTFEFAKQLIFD